MGTARLFLTPEQKALELRFKLREWIDDKHIRHLYFEGVDEAREILRDITGGSDAPDSTLMKMVAAMVSADPTFLTHVVKRNDQGYDWTDLQLATAGMICEMYHRETVEGTWPRT